MPVADNVLRQDCPDGLSRVGRFQIQQLKNVSGACALSIIDLESSGLNDLHYRNYLFTSAGLFFVFVSDDDGPQSTSTGSRTFHLFPRLNVPYFYQLPNSDYLYVVLSSGDKVVFSQKTGDIASGVGIAFNIDPNINLNNAGGVEIVNTNGIILDSGWALGYMATEDYFRKSTFRRNHFADCSFINIKLFEPVGGDNMEFRFKTDSELNSLLAENCP